MRKSKIIFLLIISVTVFFLYYKDSQTMDVSEFKKIINDEDISYSELRKVIKSSVGSNEVSDYISTTKILTEKKTSNLKKSGFKYYSLNLDGEAVLYCIVWTYKDIGYTLSEEHVVLLSKKLKVLGYYSK